MSAGSASVINCCRGHARTRTHAHTHTDRCAGWKAAEEETNEGNTRETKLTSLNKQTRRVRVLQREVMKRQSTSDQRRRGRARPREQTPPKPTAPSHRAVFLGFNCPKRQRDPGESRISYTWRKQTKFYHNKSLLLSRAFNVKQHQQEEM